MAFRGAPRQYGQGKRTAKDRERDLIGDVTTAPAARLAATNPEELATRYGVKIETARRHYEAATQRTLLL
jgi:hypothetical protein